MTGDRRLPHAFPGSDHGERGLRVAHERDRIEPEVGSDVGHPRRERPRGEPEAAARADDRLVGEIDDDVGARLRESVVQHVPDRHSVVGLPTELLAPAEHDRPDELVGKLGEGGDDDLRVVLAVDEGKRSH